MLFVEIRFFLFFLLVLGVYWALRRNRSRKLWLLAASYGFYATFDYRFLSLVVVSTLVDYSTGLALGRTNALGRRRLLLGASLVVNLGILGYFKYAEFFVDSADQLLRAVGLDPSWPTLNIVLPVGISFYTFQTLSYTIDVYRRKLEPSRSFVDVALFVGFFPQLLAGPIVRAVQFLPQTLKAHAWREVDMRASLTLILVGYLQKAVMADNLAPIVERYFDNPTSYGSTAAWIGSLLFWAQVYGDFAGYSNMAIGLAGLLGYRLPRNFDFPFLARNTADFWGRWHMTLSSWINDYVLVPLRKPGQGWARYSANIVFAMTLFGLWHGAAWKFVAWGALNGLAVAGYRTWRRRFRRGTVRRGYPVPMAMGSVGLTLLAVTLTLPFFRAASFTDALSVIQSMLFLGHSAGNGLTAFAGRLGGAGLAALLLGLLAVHWLGRRGYGRWLARLPDPAFALAYGAAVPVALALTPTAIQPFIYFQF